MRRRLTPSAEQESLEEPLVNLTPLIDVVFVVLIAFMLIAPLLHIDSIQLSSGAASNKKALPSITNHPLAIAIRSDNSIWFQGKKTTLKELQAKLKEAKQQRPNEIPQLIPDAQVYFETYNQVKNIVEACGFEQLDVVLKAS